MSSKLFDVQLVFERIPAILAYLPVTMQLVLYSTALSLIVGALVALIKINRVPVLRQIAPYCRRMIVTTVPNPRSYTAGEFSALARQVCGDVTVCPDCGEAARLALQTAEAGVLVFGSLYLASAVRPVLLQLLAPQ